MSAVDPRSSHRRRVGCAHAFLVALVATGCSGFRPCTVSPALDGRGSLCGFARPEDVDLVPDPDGQAVGGEPAALLFVSNTAGPRSIDVVRWPPGTERIHWPTFEEREDFDPEKIPAGDLECAARFSAAAERRKLAAGFEPHGIAVRRFGTTIRVAALDHQGTRDTVHFLDLIPGDRKPRLVWRGCVQLPHCARGNDLAIAGNGDVVVAKFQTVRFLPLFYPLARLGIPTGRLLRWRGGSSWEEVAGTTARLANGVAITDDGDIYFGESGSGLVWRLPADEEQASKPLPWVRVGGSPDNLWVTRDGTILVATHTSALRFLWCNISPWRCASPWEVYEIIPEPRGRPRVRRVLRDDGRVLTAVSSAVAIDGPPACHSAGAKSRPRRYFVGSAVSDRVGTILAKKPYGCGVK